MALTPITTNGPTITVSTLEELRDAYKTLSHQDGGGTILAEPGSYGELKLLDYGAADGEEPVIIASADPADPAHFSQLVLSKCSNVRIESIHVDSTGVDRPEWLGDISARGADNIQIVDSTFVHDASGDLKALGEPVEDLGAFVESTNILFQDNLVDGYFHGLSVMTTTGFEISGNEFVNMQTDPIRGSGWQDALVSGNYIHDFYPISQQYTHTDMIQIWGTNADQITKNVTISDNILVATDVATQSIFIRSGELGNDNSETSGYFENITVTNNLIYNSHLHGISIADTDGLVVDGNTLLYNPYAVLGTDAGGEGSHPVIFTSKSIDVTITNNVTPGIWASGDVDPVANNHIVTFDDPSEVSYVGNHFINPMTGKEVVLEDLHMLPTSPLYGIAGSSIGNQPGDVSDGTTAAIKMSADPDNVYEVTYDASGSFSANGPVADTAGYSFHWTLPDGTTAEGPTITTTYTSGGFKGVGLEIRLNDEVVAGIARNFAVKTKDIFELDFEDGVTNLSDGSAAIFGQGDYVASNDGTGMRIGDGNKLQIGRETEDMFDLDSFGLALDMTPTGDEHSGVFLHLYKTMEGSILGDGSVKFTLTTDQGNYSMTSREPIFDDGETHRLGIAFNGKTGQLEMFADGKSVSSVEAWGTTPQAQYWNMVFGNTWQDSVDVIIDNVAMNADPSVAGTLPVVAPKDPAEPQTPDDTPVATDPPVTNEPPVADGPAPRDTPSDNDPAGDRGTPPEAYPAAKDGGGNFLSDFIDSLLKLFGLGGDDDDKAEAPGETDTVTAEAVLSDVVPVTDILKDDVLCDDCEADDEMLDDLAA